MLMQLPVEGLLPGLEIAVAGHYLVSAAHDHRPSHLAGRYGRAHAPAGERYPQARACTTITAPMPGPPGMKRARWQPRPLLAERRHRAPGHFGLQDCSSFRYWHIRG